MLIQLKTSEIARPFPFRAFYDSTGDTLSVGIKQKGKFGISIEADDISFDLTKDGKLLNIDVWIPRKNWTVDKAIHPPEEIEKASVVFVSKKVQTEPIAYVTDPKKTLLCIRFASERVSRFITPATSLIFELNAKDQLIGLWITQIEEDINFQKESEWRRSIKAV